MCPTQVYTWINMDSSYNNCSHRPISTSIDNIWLRTNLKCKIIPRIIFSREYLNLLTNIFCTLDPFHSPSFLKIWKTKILAILALKRNGERIQDLFTTLHCSYSFDPHTYNCNKNFLSILSKYGLHRFRAHITYHWHLAIF